MKAVLPVMLISLTNRYFDDKILFYDCIIYNHHNNIYVYIKRIQYNDDKIIAEVIPKG
jgi:hypothetical protein